LVRQRELELIHAYNNAFSLLLWLLTGITILTAIVISHSWDEAPARPARWRKSLSLPEIFALPEILGRIDVSALLTIAAENYSA